MYDPTRERVILTGGSTPLNGGEAFEFFNDLWEFDGTHWKALAPSGEKMSGSALAFDSKGKRVFSFGGYRGRAVGDFRSLENGEWKALTPPAEMTAAEPGFVYDAKRERFVAFGGSAGRGGANGTTWEYDGDKWTSLDVASPPARQAHVMVYDERRGRIVVFGGMGAGVPGTRPPLLSDLWEFDGRTWTRIDAEGPAARASAGATYDASRGVVIIFGGSSADGFKGDTWAWDGTSWKQLATAGPPPRAMGYLAYDRKRDRTVLFGGREGWPNGDLNDTWEWNGSAWTLRNP